LNSLGDMELSTETQLVRFHWFVRLTSVGCLKDAGSGIARHD